MVNPDKLFGRLGNRMFQMAYIYSQMKLGNIPDIYVQDYRLFESYLDEIRQWYGDGIGYLEQISIHVRRTDYVNNPFYIDLLQTDYYKNAVDLFPKDKKFLVFSDDPEFCKTVPLFQDKTRFQIMDGGTELEDFNLMASCESNIIANSSYSYWAALLNPNCGKTIIAPSIEKWYTDGKERTICPPQWKRI